VQTHRHTDRFPHIQSDTITDHQPTMHALATAGVGSRERDEMIVCLLVSARITQESLALASMARDDSPASSTASSTAPASSTSAAIRSKVGSEFET